MMMHLFSERTVPEAILSGLKHMRDTQELKADDVQGFITALFNAEMKQEYIDLFLESVDGEEVEIESFLNNTYSMGIGRLPLYFNLINQGKFDVTILAKGMVWLGVLGVLAVKAFHSKSEKNNPVIKALQKYESVTPETAQNASMEDIHDLMIAISYQKVSIFFDPQEPVTKRLSDI